MMKPGRYAGFLRGQADGLQRRHARGAKMVRCLLKKDQPAFYGSCVTCRVIGGVVGQGVGHAATPSRSAMRAAMYSLTSRSTNALRMLPGNETGLGKCPSRTFCHR